MNIADKIEEIRRKPEHIRVRYVWFLVFISMLFVITLWIFSLKDSFPDGSQANEENNLSTNDIINKLGQEKKSLEDASQKLDNVFPGQPTPGIPQGETQNNPLNNPNNANRQ